MRIRESAQLQFDEYERNSYVNRLCEAFMYGRDEVRPQHEIEARICAAVYAIHLEICTQPDLYIAVVDRLEPCQRRALHLYAQCRGVLSDATRLPQSDAFCGELLPDGDTCILVAGHGGAHGPLPF